VVQKRESLLPAACFVSDHVRVSCECDVGFGSLTQVACVDVLV